MRLNKINDMEQGLIESREASYLLDPNENSTYGPKKETIDDITSSEYMLIDDLGKVMKVLK